MEVDPLHVVTEQERVVAITLLRRAAERGKLTAPELDRRLAAARRARLGGGLASALGGIDHYPFDTPSVEWPLLPTPATALSAVTAKHERSATSGYRVDDPLVVAGGLESVRIGGPWIVPLHLRVHAGLSSVRLDCRAAHAAASTIDVEVRAGLTTIVMVLPGGWAADAGAVRRDVGTLRVKVPREADAGCPTVVLHGRLGITTLIVRGENLVDRWRDASSRM